MLLDGSLDKVAFTQSGRARPWRQALIRLSAAYIGLALFFAADWLAMFDQWWNSSTYNHMLLVPVILAWLVWQRRHALARLEPRCWSPGLIAVGGAAVIWLLGAMASLDLLRQAGAVAMLPASAALLLGPKIMVALAFPTAYAVFLIPFGDEFIPALQTITARLTVSLVQLSQVPASVDGVFINTPAGLFEVAEACSGVKFLVAMIALGVLIGNVGFRSWQRRGIFMLLCIFVPILANGVRAWGTIYIAQHIGAARAGGIDHIIYGWIFFAGVIAAIMGLSWRFFDRNLDDPIVNPAAIDGSPFLSRIERFSLRPTVAIMAMVLLVVGAQAWAKSAEKLMAPLPPRIELPLVPGWQRIDYSPKYPWNPAAGGADHRLLGRYGDGAGHEVDVFFALYSAQYEGKEAGGFGQGALRADSGWSWVNEGPPAPTAKVDRLLAAGSIERITETYYRTGTLLSGSNLRLKLANMYDRILLRRRSTMLLILSAEQDPKATGAPGLIAFRKATGPVAPWMDRMAAGR